MAADRSSEPTIEVLGPVACATVAWRWRGALHVTVIVKATFALVAEGETPIAIPDEVIRAEAHHGNNPMRSVRVTSDLAPLLARADVVLTGHACAPHGQPVTSLAARLAVLRDDEPLLDKTLHVFGDRPKGELLPFERMPIVYERAFGGIGWDENPIGLGLRQGDRAPNLVDPADPRRTACFAPISRTWPLRRRLLAKADRKALDAPVAEIPDELEWMYFQTAPEDQRIELLRGDEWIVLEGLDAERPGIASRLPGARAVARVHGSEGVVEPVLVADTLRIDADAGRCSVVWRGAIPVEDEAAIASLHVVAGLELPGVPVVWPGDGARRATPRERLDTVTELLDESDLAATLVRRGDQEASREPAEPLVRTQELTADEARPAATSALPFTPRTQILSVSTLLKQPSPAFTGTFVLSPDEMDDLGSRADTPFTGAPPARPSEPAGPIPGAPWSGAPKPPDPPRPRIAQEETHDLGPPAGDGPGAARFFHRAARGEEAEAVHAPKERDIPPRSTDAIPFVTRAPVSAFTLPWQIGAEREVRVVVIKATFDLVAGGPATIRDEPDLPTGDVHLDGDVEKSVLYPSDFALMKPRADVTVTGHAHAPGGSAAATVVGIAFGRKSKGFDRRVAVFGDRRWREGLLDRGPSEPRRFDRIPLVHERAYGGPGLDENPIGIGHGHGFTMLPNLEDPEHLIKHPGDAPAPAALGPIPMRWRARWSKLGTYDARWQKTRWPYFPDDFDWSFFQAAPPSQQLDAIEGDEPFEIAGMSAAHPRLAGTLPGTRTRCFAQRTTEAGGAFHEVALRLDTVAFDMDEESVNLVWRGLLEVQDEDASEIAELFVITEPTAGPRAAVADVEARYRAEKAVLEPITVDPDADTPANDRTEEDPVPAHTERIRARLGAAGIAAGAGAAVAMPRGAAAAETPAAPDPVRARVVALLAGGTPLDGLDLSGADLSGLDFSGRSMIGTMLSGARLAGCRFTGADLSQALFAEADLTDAALDGATLDLADLAGAELAGAKLDGASLAQTNLAGARGERASFLGARGELTRFEEGTWTRARFDGAEIDGADFTRASLDDADFEGAKMPSIRLYDARGERASFVDAILDDACADGARLPRCSFAGARAPSSVWDKADLEESSFLGATLTGASFARASCARAVFSGADLTDARLGRADLREASLLRSNLMTAKLEGADLTNADLRGANLHAAETWRAKLGGARLDLAITTQTKLGARS